MVLIGTSACTNKTSDFLVIGHRGAMGHETENTLASIQKALELGVDMIEIDVFKIASGEIVVFHDNTVERLTNGKGNIEEYTIEDLRNLTLEGGYKIPLLKDVLELIDNDVKLNIELKGVNTATDVNHIVTYYVKERSWSPNNFIISSFEWDELKVIRKINPTITIAVLIEGDPLKAIDIGEELNAVAINPDFETLTEKNVKELKKEGFKVYPWTVNNPNDVDRMMKLGVDGIFTNYPERVN